MCNRFTHRSNYLILLILLARILERILSKRKLKPGAPGKTDLLFQKSPSCYLHSGKFSLKNYKFLNQDQQQHIQVMKIRRFPSSSHTKTQTGKRYNLIAKHFIYCAEITYETLFLPNHLRVAGKLEMST